jgi:hypothetical protein
MTEYIEIGPAPANEECAQTGTDEYGERSRRECRRFITLLRAAFGQEPEGARLRVQEFPHDFGTYREVVCEFDSAKPAAVRYAQRCESDQPGEWVFCGIDYRLDGVPA